MTIRFAAIFDNHQVKSDGTVVLRFKASFVELANAMQVVRYIKRMAWLVVQVNGEAIRLGNVTFDGLRIDREGASVIAFASDVAVTETQQIAKLIRQPMRVALVAADDTNWATEATEAAESADAAENAENAPETTDASTDADAEAAEADNGFA